jgi:hypothetical protein
MRKKSRYKPRQKLDNPLAFVLTNVMPVSADPETNIKLRATNHAAIDELSKGRGTVGHLQILIDAFNMAFVLAKRGKGSDWLPEIGQAQSALRTLAERSKKIGRYTLTGPELAAINLGLEIHDAQLDNCTVGELGSAVDYIAHRIYTKQVVTLPKVAA